MNNHSVKLECLKLVMNFGSRSEIQDPRKQAQILFDFVISDKAEAPQKSKGGRPSKKK